VKYRLGEGNESLLSILFFALIEEDHTQFESKDPQIGEQLYKNFLKSTSVLTKKFPQSQADILFAKVMAGQRERGLNMERFFNCLSELGEARYEKKKSEKRA
jgi:hypothetical protein